MDLLPFREELICHNDLTCKTDIIKNLGWDKPKQGGIRDVDVDQIDWYLERTYGLKNYKARDINTINHEDKYICRKDKAGIVYDKKAMKYASKQLGHERIDVIANSYLHNL